MVNRVILLNKFVYYCTSAMVDHFLLNLSMVLDHNFVYFCIYHEMTHGEDQFIVQPMYKEF